MRETIRFAGLDVHKSTISVAIASGTERGEVRSYGQIANRAEAVAGLLERLGGSVGRLRCCYEAGPMGYGLQRQITALGHECVVVAPSLIPRRAGDRIKTDRRDAMNLARLHRAGELTPVWVPDREHEAMRDLVRTRLAAVRSVRLARQQLSGFLLRHGFSYSRPAWTQMHRRWIAGLRFEHAAHYLVLEDLIATEEVAVQRRQRLTGQIEGMLEGWALGPVVQALQSLRGMALVTAASLVAELGDMTRFSCPSKLMAFVGLVPSEHSSGECRRQGGITKAGNEVARRMLIEAAWSYRFPARIGRDLRIRQENLPKPIRDIAWQAQQRLCQRYRRLIRAGKPANVAVVAIARELVGFVWAIAQQVPVTPTQDRRAPHSMPKGCTMAKTCK